MTDNYIQLGKGNIVEIGIKTADGKDTGEKLVFDLEDVELPLRYQQIIEQDKKNRERLTNRIAQIQSHKDIKRKKILSKNEEDIIKATKEFIDDEIENFNLFLGENGVQKLLNGRKLGVESLNEIEEIIVNQIQPLLDKNMQSIVEKMKEKYSKKEEKEIEVL